MTAAIGWGVPVLLWIAVTLGARGWLARLDLVRCRAGDWGTAFLAGFTLYTVLLFAGALAGIPIAWPLYLGAALVVAASGILAGRAAPARERPPEPPWTPAEIVVAAAVGAYAVLVVLNALFYPVLAMDAHSYDGRARFFIHDGTLDLAIYHWPGNPVTGKTNIAYPPLYSLGLGLTYAFGGWQSKILTAAMSLAWPMAVYGFLRSRLPRWSALGWVLFIALTPEVLSHASYALLNVPAMALTAAEAITLARFLDERRPAWLALAAVLAAGAAGVRPDALAAHGALWGTATLFLAVGGDGRFALRRRALAWLGVALAPLVTWGVWTLYLRYGIGLSSLNPATSETRIGVGRIVAVLPRILGDLPTYGVFFYVWALSIPAAALGWRRRPELRFPATAAFAVLAALVFVFAILDTDYGGGMVDVLRSSFKRSLFYIVPLAGIAAALSLRWPLWVRAPGGEPVVDLPDGDAS